MKASIRPHIYLHLAVLLFGAAGVLGKILALAPLTLVFGRSLFAALSLLPIVLWKRDGNWRRAGKRAVLCGALLAMHWLSFFAALQCAPVAFGMLGFASFPLFVAVLEPFFFDEHRQVSDILFAVLMGLGMRLLLDGANWERGAMLALLLGALSALLFAVLILLNRAQTTQLSSIQVAMNQNAIAAICLLPWIFMNPGALLLSRNDWLGLMLLGAVFTALSHSLFVASLQSLTARLASIASGMEPVYAMLLAWYFLHERITLQAGAGAVVICLTSVAAAYAHTSQHSQKSIDISS